MKVVKKKSTENCHFYSREKSLYIAWACFCYDCPMDKAAKYRHMTSNVYRGCKNNKSNKIIIWKVQGVPQ